MFSAKRKFEEFNFGTKINSNKKKNKKSENEIDANEIDANLLSELINENSLSSKKTEKKIERDGNHIYFYSEVNRETIYDLCSLIKEAEEECIITSYKLGIDKYPTYIHINSFGGCVFSAFDAIDCIQTSKVPVYSIVQGATASAGTLISVCCEKRFMTKNAHMLIHQLSAGCWGKMSEIEDEFENLKGLMTKIKNIYIENTKIPKKELSKILEHDIWFDFDTSLKFNLVDEIWV